MKKFLNFMLMMIGIVLMSTVATSCRDHRHRNIESIEDSTVIHKQDYAIDMVVPNATGIIAYVIDKREQQKVDSTLCSIPNEVLGGLCNYLTNKGEKLSPRSVYNEYLLRKDYYDSMSQSIRHPIPTNITTIIEGKEDSTHESNSSIL